MLSCTIHPCTPIESKVVDKIPSQKQAFITTF